MTFFRHCKKRNTPAGSISSSIPKQSRCGASSQWGHWWDPLSDKSDVGRPWWSDMTSSQLGPRCALRGGTENQKLWVTTASFSDTPGRFERRRHRTRMSSMTMLSSRPGCPLRRCRTDSLSVQKATSRGVHGTRGSRRSWSVACIIDIRSCR